jgi:hypothetical protein
MDYTFSDEQLAIIKRTHKYFMRHKYDPTPEPSEDRDPKDQDREVKVYEDRPGISAYKPVSQTHMFLPIDVEESHADELAQLGIKPTIIKSGRMKDIGLSNAWGGGHTDLVAFTLPKDIRIHLNGDHSHIPRDHVYGVADTYHYVGIKEGKEVFKISVKVDSITQRDFAWMKFSLA